MTSITISDAAVTAIRKYMESALILLGSFQDSRSSPTPSISLQFALPVKSADILLKTTEYIQLVSNIIPIGIRIVGIHINTDQIKGPDEDKLIKSIQSLLGYAPVVGKSTVKDTKLSIDFFRLDEKLTPSVKPIQEVFVDPQFFFITIPPQTLISSEQLTVLFKGDIYIKQIPDNDEKIQINEQFPSEKKPLILSQQSSEHSNQTWIEAFNPQIGGLLSSGIHLVINLLVSSTPGGKSKKQKKKEKSESETIRTTDKPINILFYFPRNILISQLVEQIISTICSPSINSNPNVALFWEQEQPFPIILPITDIEQIKSQSSEKEALQPKLEVANQSIRRQIHDLFAIPLKPIFRPKNALQRLQLIQLVSKPKGQQSSSSSTSSSSSSYRLRNVHESIPSSNSDEWVSFIIEGSYEYCHYGQDNENDEGWGCAYRSLQTLLSWFIIQGYADVNILGLREIQQLLVNMGDKPSKWAAEGEKPWIGSVEVSMVLQNYIDVDCRIINMGSGNQFGNHFEELASHFRNEGTPIMIGGGVLAYTLLGVRQNTETEAQEYLILDPHYTGKDQIGQIISKKWVGWFTQSLFRTDVFYNLCLPQRPTRVDGNDFEVGSTSIDSNSLSSFNYSLSFYEDDEEDDVEEEDDKEEDDEEEDQKENEDVHYENGDQMTDQLLF
ncbi:MAG: putative Ufm1-specific protease 2 [Streblomastix strix]|uniref:Putative Ufm1-specific protease 2 n=1 Tax=Streblomastix strix TaxID=222440 RepID=A0A5J4VR02_9EUKA|nr:MAG: putative Ufm1-specific protease 2 [Streblomastix strix]